MKNTRIPWRKMVCSTGEILRFTLSEKDTQVYVFARGTGEFSITVEFVNEDGEFITLPIAYGSSVDGAYCFDSAKHLNIVPKSKTVTVAAYVSQTDIRRRETVDPIPKRLVLPTSQDSFEQRLLRQFTELLDQRTGGGVSRGYDYKVHDDYSDSDPDMGSGYEVDEALEEQLDRDIVARRNSRSAPADKGVQPSNVSDNDKRDGRKLDVQPEAGYDFTPSDPDQRDRIAALESALRDLRKSSS